MEEKGAGVILHCPQKRRPAGWTQAATSELPKRLLGHVCVWQSSCWYRTTPIPLPPVTNSYLGVTKKSCEVRNELTGKGK